MLVVVPNPDTIIGKTGLAAADTVERLVMVLLLMFPVVTAQNPVCKELIWPPAVKFVNVLKETVSVAPPLLVPADSDKITPPPVRFDRVLFETVVLLPEKLKLIPVI